MSINVLTAAQSTRTLLKEREAAASASRDSEGQGIEHALWMLVGITLGYIQDEKAHRWLGYAQSILVESGRMSLEELKNINRLSSYAQDEKTQHFANSEISPTQDFAMD